ncbi:MAG: AAA family ATPase [Spirochaetota bacterium]
MQPLSIGIQTFRQMIEGDYLYIDKTRNIYDLIKYPKGAYFLSRPRRFGKSLLISTLDEIFRGNKELFQGLWMHNTEFAWKQYPVLRFDFSQQKATTPEALIEFLQNQIDQVAESYSIHLSKSHYYERFRELIFKLGEKENVVILIDEYDKPIIDHIDNTEMAVKMREVMKGFFTVLKGNDEYIRFLLLTGVSKFSRAGVFSNLNHLEDITLNDDFSALVGITEEELIHCFAEYIQQLQKKEKLSTDVMIAKIRHWYNGYLFSPEGTLVYNPFSTLLLFKSKRFQHHWFETGTPSFLVDLILQKQYDVMDIPIRVSELSFSSYEVDDLGLIALLQQTGYLTIKSYNPERMLYELDYPNYEVKMAFLTYLTKKLHKREYSDSILFDIIDSLNDKDIESCIKHIQKVFLSIDYDLHLSYEKYYQTIFYLVFTLIGMRIQAEVKTNQGRIDAVIVDKHIYIFEFKLGGSKEEALQQIKDKKYYEKYLDSGKQIFLIGAEFHDRNIGEYVVEKWLDH